MEKVEIKGLNEYQARALETAAYPAQFKTIYPALGLTGEAGEVSDKVKKILRDTVIMTDAKGTIMVPEDRRTEIAKELGDVLWYCAVLANDLGYSLQEIAEMNYSKLQSRKERGKIGGSGDNR